jgi:hypothetical protein
MSLNSYDKITIPDQFTRIDRRSNDTAVCLDHKLTNSEARINDEVKKVLIFVIRQAIVIPYHDYYYRVDFGPGVRPQYHIVSHDLYCACALEADCAAVIAVRIYLREGGELVNTPRPGYFLTVPHACPVCGAKTYYYPRLSSRNRGIGWSCEQGGTSHYWKHELAVLQRTYAEKWKQLGVNPATFKDEVSGFNFKDDYDPEREPTYSCPDKSIANPKS